MQSWLEGEPIPSLNQQILAFGEDYRSYRCNWKTTLPFERTLKIQEERRIFIKQFGFSVPSAEAIEILSKHQPILEIGAGTGYWSRLLNLNQIDVIATDPQLSNPGGFQHQAYFPCLKLDAVQAISHHSGRNIFCSWPSLNENWLKEAAKLLDKDQFLFAVYEEACANEETWDYIRENFEEICDLELISWYWTHDRFMGWKKR